MCQAIMHHFWCRWHQEYLQTLQSRSKWRKKLPNLQEGDIVLLKEKWPKMLHWPLAKILQVYPGEDNLVRVAKIQTQFGVYTRPVVKLALLTRPEKEKDLPPQASSAPRSMSSHGHGTTSTAAEDAPPEDTPPP